LRALTALVSSREKVHQTLACCQWSTFTHRHMLNKPGTDRASIQSLRAGPASTVFSALGGRLRIDNSFFIFVQIRSAKERMVLADCFWPITRWRKPASTKAVSFADPRTVQCRFRTIPNISCGYCGKLDAAVQSQQRPFVRDAARACG